MSTHWLSRLLLLRPKQVALNLERVRASGLIERTPNVWQVTLGVLRMWHRLIYRSDTVGTCSEFPVRASWRARALQFRGVRFPFLMAEKAVAPWDMSGMLSPPQRLKRHLLGAHHDNNQFAYDLQILACHQGELERLLAEARELVEHDTPRSRWLRDLTVYEQYHDKLLSAVERAVDGDFGLSSEEEADPDVSFLAYLSWCARQPATPQETLAAWRAGSLRLSSYPEAASC